MRSDGMVSDYCLSLSFHLASLGSFKGDGCSAMYMTAVLQFHYKYRSGRSDALQMADRMVLPPFAWKPIKGL